MSRNTLLATIESVIVDLSIIKETVYPIDTRSSGIINTVDNPASNLIAVRQRHSIMN